MPKSQENCDPVVRISKNEPKEFFSLFSESHIKDHISLITEKTTVDDLLIHDKNDYFADSKINFLANSNGKIDYILTYSNNVNIKKEKKIARKRHMYFKSLLKFGLILDIVRQEYPTEGSKTISFVKIFIPKEILLLHAERLKMKLPLKGKVKSNPMTICKKVKFFTMIKRFFKPKDEKKSLYYGAPYRQEFADKFDLTVENAFSDDMRICIVLEFLQRAQFGPEPTQIGLSKLMAEEIFDQAYPLHQGHWLKNETIHECPNDRQWLHENWAQPKCFYRFQPLNRISKYCGTKVAIYFAMLGYYTSWLFPVSIIGLLTFCYGVQNMQSSSQVSLEICDSTKSGKTILCPPCDAICNYEYLKSSCTYARLNGILENEVLIVFTILMSCWAKLYIKFWNRKQRKLQFRWDMNIVTRKEGVRPEYESQCIYKRENSITGEEELYMTKREKTIRYFISSVSVLFMVLLLILFFLKLIICRVLLGRILYHHMSITPAKMITSAIIAFVYLLLIICLGWIYQLMALKMTEFERPRTENEFDNRFTFKMYCFYFFSHYLSIFYIAFFKPFLYGPPTKHFYIFPTARLEECNPTGCLFDVTIEMAILFCGKQFLLNLYQFFMPKVMNILRRRRLMHLHPQVKDDENILIPQWEKDYYLCPFDRTVLYYEYLAIVIQFGFIALFIAAFPLAPLFAFINNMVELRLDALKIITQYRRTAGFRTRDIGTWMYIIKIIASLGVVTNSLIIGLTSDFIPKFIYKYFYSSNQSLDGFSKFSLSEFNIKDFHNDTMPYQSHVSQEFTNISTCFYPAFRESYTSERKYEFSQLFWTISFGRVAFIIIYQHIILLLTKLITSFVPDTPTTVKMEIKREEFLNEELLFGSNQTSKQKHEIKEKFRLLSQSEESLQSKEENSENV